MFNSIQTKIAIPVIGILIAVILVVLLYASYTIQNFAAGRSQERLQGAKQAAQAYLEQLESYNRINSRAAAGIEGLAEIVYKLNIENNENLRRELYDYLKIAARELEAASFMPITFVVTDNKGYVLVHTTDIEYYGESDYFSPAVRAALEGRPIETTYSSTNFIEMGLSSSAPIMYGGEIAGTISTVMCMGSLGFVDKIAEIFNAEATVFKGHTSIASTLFLDREAGIRAVGTEAALAVRESVLERGEAYDTELNLFGARHHAYYFPLSGWEGKPIGMFFIGFSVENSENEVAALTKNGAVLGATGLFIAAAVMFLGINFNARKVKKLSVIVKNIAMGGSYNDLYQMPLTNDEVGVLTSSVITLVNTINKLSAGGSFAEIKKHIDDTQRHAIESEVANKAKSDFLSRMSHEIRTPMGAILGITEIQLRNKNLNEETMDAFDKIYNSCDMLLGIINDLLDLSRIEAGKMELNVEPYDVASMISDAVQLNVMYIEEKPIEFEVEVNDAIPAGLYGDELRIKQILSNVLSNAFKYTAKGLVSMSVGKVAYSSDTVTLVFTVSDTGQGMTPEQVTTIFDEFTRFNHEANREAEGTGLGMSITKNLVTLMSGTISVKSESGEGSTFEIRIPQKVADSVPLGKETTKNIINYKNAVSRKQVQTEWENMSHGKVLIVDDLNANVYVAKGLLAPYELQVDSACSGFEAIEKIKDGAFYDIIFMDHMMPKMDGIETTRRLRAMGYVAPIVVYTANAIVGKEDEFMAVGFNAFLSKPIQSKHLDAVLNKFINVKNVSVSENKTDPELYREFKRSTKTIVLDLQNALRKKDYKTAILLMHTLKSLAGIIGETELMMVSSQAEAAFRKETHPADIVDIIKTELEKVLIRITAEIKNVTILPASKPTKKQAKKILKKAEKFLKNNNAEIINMIPSISQISGTEKLADEILKYNFTQALDELKKI
jgi:signal transduction histidine kinase/DNA-binding response OmpR family regulator/type II secretory pathway pseudopilin PulG